MGIALDTNIFILAYNPKDSKGQRALELLNKIRESNVYISVLVLEEFLIKIYKQGLEKNLSQYENFLTSGGLFTVVDVSREIARQAAKLRADYPSLRTPDALHLASAISSGANIFYTTDRRIPPKFGKLKVNII